MLVVVEVLRLANQVVAEVQEAVDQDQIAAPEFRVEQTLAVAAAEALVQVVPV
jgi:hypothetical protein